MSMKISRLLRVHGKVHGVGYRKSMHDEASRLGLVGWVRNRRDGTVEALVCGDEGAVEILLVWAERGPLLARVEKVDVSEPVGSFYREFSIYPTE